MSFLLSKNVCRQPTYLHHEAMGSILAKGVPVFILVTHSFTNALISFSHFYNLIMRNTAKYVTLEFLGSSVYQVCLKQNTFNRLRSMDLFFCNLFLNVLNCSLCCLIQLCYVVKINEKRKNAQFSTV